MNNAEYTQAISTDCGKGFRIGNDLYLAPVHVDGKYFLFTPKQQYFLYCLTKDPNADKAAAAVGWTAEQVEKFFACRKWREYKERLLAKAAVRNGDLRDFWWEFMLAGAKGHQERYEGKCDRCHQAYALPPQVAEQYADDNMELRFQCKICAGPVPLTYNEVPFRPSREQVQCAVEIGNRVEPKTERVQHSFSEETFIFSAGGTE